MTAEPTDDMLIAGQEAWMRLRKTRPAMEDCEEARAVWAAMTAAAPVDPRDAALEFAAQHISSDWPERCQEIVRRARAALGAGGGNG